MNGHDNAEATATAKTKYRDSSFALLSQNDDGAFGMTREGMFRVTIGAGGSCSDGEVGALRQK